MAVPTHPRPKMVAESDLPNEHWATNALVELKQTLLEFPLWPSVLLHCDDEVLPNYPTRGTWVERALAAHLQDSRVESYTVDQAWKKGGDLDIFAILVVDERHGILVIIETDNTRKDQIGHKYLDRLEIMRTKLDAACQSNPDTDFIFLYVTYCYSGDSAYTLTNPVSIMQSIAFQVGLPFVYWGFVPEAKTGHPRFHPTGKVGNKVNIHISSKKSGNPLPPVRKRSDAIFIKPAKLEPKTDEECELTEGSQNLNIAQIKGFLYFPEEYHELMLDWDRLKTYLDKGR